MAFVDDLAGGKLGLVVVPPGHLTATKQTATSVAFSDPEQGVGWWFYFFPHIHLDLSSEHMPLLERDVRRHTRLLFDVMYAIAPPGMPTSRPRTDDTNWAPVIEIERVDVNGGAALHVLHRLQYQPTRESIMGHTLVPVAGGLFEARWYCLSKMTGIRESVVMDKLLGETKEPSFPPQSAYDDPALDEVFPQHPLSIARAAKRWCSDGKLQITSSPPRPTAAVTLDSIGCAIVVPPRFICGNTTTGPGGTTCELSRVSFSGTDGIDFLFVTRTKERIRGIAVARRLAKLAEERAMTAYRGWGVTNILCNVTPLDVDRPAVMVVTEGDSAQTGCGRARAVWRWFVDDGGHVWSIALHSTVAVPIDELSSDIAAISESWRRL